VGNQSITEQYEALPQIAKILIQIFAGNIISALYRFLRYSETKQQYTLLVGILALLPGISRVIWIVDIATEVTSNRITFVAA